MAVVSHDLPGANAAPNSSKNAAENKIQNYGIEAFKDITFGSIAGVLGKFIEYPFDTVKVRLQAQTTLPQGAPLNGPLDVIGAAFRAPEGPIRSLYRGISAPLLGAAIETSSLFFSYRMAQDILVSMTPSLRKASEGHDKMELPFSALLACGGASGAFTSLLLTPIELIKCKMQVPVTGASSLTPRPPTPSRLIRNIFAAHGILGFWHGQLGTLIRETGGSAAWFGTYEGLKKIFLRYNRDVKTKQDIKLWQQICAGASAGMAYNFVFYPADTVKSRMQTEAGKTRTSFYKTTKDIWRQQGLSGFYRGCGITVFRAAPSSAIIFSIYEGMKEFFG